MRLVSTVGALGLASILAACTSVPPNDVAGAGPGFGTSYGAYGAEQQARDAALSSGESIILPEGADPTDLAVAEAVAAGEDPDPNLLRRGPGISDENSFDAVSERVTIESDRQRLAAQREAFQVIEPTALPDRPSGDLASIVEFALSTSHPVGQPVYSRSPIRLSSRACDRYSDANAAQQAFLNAGGPERDRSGLDPDGDGYACRWDPSPFRLAVHN